MRGWNGRMAVAAVAILLAVVVQSVGAGVNGREAARDLRASLGSSLPEGLRGFRGVMVGRIVRKDERSFVLRVNEVTRVAEQNQASRPESAVGMQLTIVAPPDPRTARQYLGVLGTLKVGDRVSVGAIHLGGDSLAAVEELRKLEPILGVIAAGEPSWREQAGEAWAEQGRIVGPVRNSPGAEIHVLDAEGTVVKSVGLRRGQNGYEIEWLAPGTYTLRVAARGCRTLELKSLEVKARHDLVIPLEFSRLKRIDHSRPRWRKRASGQWREMGWIVGDIERCPGAEIHILDEDGQLVRSEYLREGQETYDIKLLEPDDYVMRVAAEGYVTLELEVRVRAGGDLSVDLEFEGQDPAHRR